MIERLEYCDPEGHVEEFWGGFMAANTEMGAVKLTSMAWLRNSGSTMVS